MNRRAMLLGCAVLGACSSVQEVSAPVEPGRESAATPRYQPMLVIGTPPLSAGDAGPPLQAMVARDTPLGDVLLAMFRDSDVNLVLDPGVESAPCTFDLKRATVEEAFEAVLRSQDLGYEWDGSFLRVRRTAAETLFVDVLTPGFGGATGAGGAAAGGAGGGAGGLAGGGGLGPQNGQDVWEELEEAVPMLVGDGARVVINRAAGSIHLEASPSAIARVRELVGTTVRRANAQVSLEARILEVRLNDEYRLGVNWSLLPGFFDTSKTGLASGGGVVTQTAGAGGTSFTFGLLDGGDWSVLIDSLEQQGQVRVLSSPRVSTVNNVPASIRVADQIPVITREFIDVQGGVARTQYSVDFVEAGVSVDVTPRIGEDGMVAVHVLPQVTERIGTVVTPDGLVVQPILSTRSTDTIVRVADGQAIVLGGLRSTRKEETRTGVPFLMDIPWLGQAFSSTVQTRSEVELMIVLVPRLLDASWIDDEVRRGAHRMVMLRQPFQWNPLGLEHHRPEEWAAGTLQTAPTSASGIGVRTPDPVPAERAPDQGRTVTRAGLAGRLLMRAQQALEAGQSRQAEALLDETLRLEPRHVDALIVAAMLAQRHGAAGKARSLLERATAVAPRHPGVATARGAFELQFGAAPAAVRWFAAAHQQLGTAWSACNLAAAQLATGDLPAARDLLESFAANAAGDAPPELFANLAWAQHALGEPAAARQSCQRALQAGADPRNPRLQALLRIVGLQ